VNLETVYESDDLIAINKPHGLLVHRTNMAKDAKEFALQMVRDMVKHKVFPCHRIDRKTSGVLLFAKHTEANRAIQQLFRSGMINKTYQAIVRGHVQSSMAIDSPLKDGSISKAATTEITPLKHYSLPIQTDRYPTSRYSLLEIKPKTGRYHQIRKHLAHIRHPIIGDRPHGCNKQNRYWKQHHNMVTMMLHAQELVFTYREEGIKIQAEPSAEFKKFQAFLLMSDDIDPYIS